MSVCDDVLEARPAKVTFNPVKILIVHASDFFKYLSLVRFLF